MTDLINVNEMAGLCCVVPRVIRRWIAEGRLDSCNPQRAELTGFKTGRIKGGWTLDKDAAMRYAEEYKRSGGED